MKIFKSVLSVVLLLCMIVPMAAFGSFAEEASLDIETNLVVTSRMKSALKRAKKCVKNG